MNAEWPTARLQMEDQSRPRGYRNRSTKMFRKLFGMTSKVPSQLRADLVTDSGMLCVWDAKPFAAITDYDSWEKELCEDEDIMRHLQAGHLVPINLGDGVYTVELRQGSADSMSQRESEYLLVPSQPYLLNSTGRILISGLEHVGADPRTFLECELPPGSYTVQVQLIDWTEEPGSKDSNGRPTSNALPDIIVFVQPSEMGAFDYRQSLEIFRKEDALR
jgi:hypothetical protein